MDIREFLRMFIDEDSQEFEIWSDEKKKVIYKGYLSDLPEEFEFETINSIDNINKQTHTLTINID